jgi:transposase InsO family protein
LELACALRRENPQRTGAQIARIIAETQGWSPAPRTLQRHFAKLGLDRRHPTGETVAFGRFEASAVNELWVGDGLVGPSVAGRRAVLVAFLDDHSRAFVGYRWSTSEDAVRAAAALRAGIAARGIPQAVYLDNGSGFVSASLLRACAVLGVRLIHSRPGRPEGRGKIERVFRTKRTQTVLTGHLGFAVLPGLVAAAGWWSGGVAWARAGSARRGGRRWGLIEGYAEVYVDLPAGDADLLDDDAHQPLASGEVELVDAGRDRLGEVADAFP